MRIHRRFLHWAAWSLLAVLAGIAPEARAQMGGQGGGFGAGGGGGGAGGGAGLGGGAGTSGGSSLLGGTGTSSGSSLLGGTGMSGGTGTSSGASYLGSQGGLGGAGRGAGAVGGTAVIPSNVNPFRGTYVNPLAYSYGVPNLTKTNFGQPRYGSTGLSTNPNLGGLTGMTGMTGMAGAGFTTVGIRRAPQYSTTLSEEMPLVIHPQGQLLQKISAEIQRSRYLSQRDSIRVRVDGNTVLLSGQVATAKERRIAEGLARLTPGVRNVVNELQVTPTAPTPRLAPPGTP